MESDSGVRVKGLFQKPFVIGSQISFRKEDVMKRFVVYVIIAVIFLVCSLWTTHIVCKNVLPQKARAILTIQDFQERQDYLKNLTP